LRQQEQAAALTALARAEEEHARIEAELERVERRLGELTRENPSLPAGASVNAAALESDSAHREVVRDRAAALDGERENLQAALAGSRATVDRALEAVAAATRALDAVGL